MNIQIKHRFNGSVLFECEAESLKAALEIGIGENADLGGAYLRNAYLRNAYLGGADLGGAYLGGADLIDGGQDSRGYQFIGQHKDDTLWIHAGCRYFSIEEAEEHWNLLHKEQPELRAECQARVALIKQIAIGRGWLTRKEEAA